MCRKIFPKIESTIYFVTVWTWRCHFCLRELSNQLPAPCFEVLVLLPGLPLKGNDLRLFKIQKFHFILIIAWLFLLQIWHKDFRELKWNKTWSNENSSVLMNTEYLVHSVGCAHLLTVLWCSESSPALLKLSEGWIDCVTRDLWKFFEKSIFHLWLFAFCFPFPSWKGFLELNISVPCIPQWCTFPQNCRCCKVVSPDVWDADSVLLLAPPRICSDFSHVEHWGRGQEGKQEEGCCPLFLFFFN